MVWEPFALAVIMGLLVSAAIYFIVMWPQVEPLDPEDLPAAAVVVPASTAAASDDDEDEPAHHERTGADADDAVSSDA